MKSRPELYATGGAVQASGGIYIPRQADKDLLAWCKAGDYAAILTARQMGKSSLMVRTAKQLESIGGQAAQIDLNEIGTKVKTPEEWYVTFLEIVADNLDLETDVKTWWAAQSNKRSVTNQLILFFRDVLLQEIQSKVVIFVDEIDTTLSLDFTDDFFAAIRSIYNARAEHPDYKRLCFVLIGVVTPSDLIKDPKRTPYNIGRRIDITDFTRSEVQPLAEGLGLGSYIQANRVLNWIFEWTNGHPYLTQLLCFEVSIRKQQNWQRGEIDQLVDDLFFGEQSNKDHNLQFVRDMLTVRAPIITREAVDDEQENSAIGQVLGAYRDIREGKKIHNDERSAVIAHLKLSGAVVPDSGDYLIVRNRIYRRVFDVPWIEETQERLQVADPIELGRLRAQAEEYDRQIKAEQRKTEKQKDMAREQQERAEAEAQRAEIEAQQAAAARRVAEEKEREAAQERERAAAEARSRANIQRLAFLGGGILAILLLISIGFVIFFNIERGNVALALDATSTAAAIAAQESAGQVSDAMGTADAADSLSQSSEATAMAAQTVAAVGGQDAQTARETAVAAEASATAANVLALDAQATATQEMINRVNAEATATAFANQPPPTVPPTNTLVPTDPPPPTNTLVPTDPPPPTPEPVLVFENDITSEDGDLGNGIASIPVTLVNAPNQTVQVNYETVTGGTAEVNVDYTPISDVLVFNGDGTQDIVIPIIQDSCVEPDETILITLTPNGFTPTGSTMATFTIRSDPSDLINESQISVGFANQDPRVLENAGIANLEVVIDAAPCRTTTVDYATSDVAEGAIAGDDYTETTGTLTYDATSQLSQIIEIPIVNNSESEGDETFQVTLSNPTNTQIGGLNPFVVSIIDINKPSAQLVAPTSVGEDAGTVPITVQLDGTSLAPISVDLEISDGTATLGEDYQAPPGATTLQFPPGTIEQSVNIEILDDTLFEVLTQTVELKLSNPINTQFTSPTTLPTEPQMLTTTLNIIDNETAIQFSQSSFSVEEAAGLNGTANLILLRPIDQDVEIITVSTSNGTALDGVDYFGGECTICARFPAGVTSSPLELPQIISDTLFEGNEDFFITILSVNNPRVSIGDMDVATINIIDDELPPPPGAEPLSVPESLPTPSPGPWTR